MQYLDIAIDSIHKILFSKTQDEKGIHAETVIALLAEIIGMQLAENVLKDNTKTKAESLKLLEQEGSEIIRQLFNSVKHSDKDINNVMTEIPEENAPRELPIETKMLLKNIFISGFRKRNISEKEDISILLLALIKLIKLTNQALDEEIAVKIAFQKIVFVSNEIVKR